jgi:aryl-alcohol dehydrogenase-like predicted oxidoreductase
MSTLPAAAAGVWVLGDRTVNRVGFGAMRLTGNAVFSTGTPSNRDRAVDVLQSAVRHGVNLIDTASFYFSQLRSANELINRALSPYPADLVIATKVGPSRDPSGEWLPGATPEHLRGLVEENLRQLGLDEADLVYLRVSADMDFAGCVEAMVALQSAGLVRNLGLSGVTLQQFEQALTIASVVAVQNRYTIELRNAVDDAVLTACRSRGIAFVPYFSIASLGRHAGRGQEDNTTVAAVAETHGATPAQVRLAWTLQLAENVLVIPGTGNPAHLDENVRAAGLRLGDHEIAALDASVDSEI